MIDDLINRIHSLLRDHGQVPQGLKELGIKGRRECDMRYEMYGFDLILKDTFDVLDIGCNCGFLSCLIAKKVRRVVGIDINKILIEIANLASIALNLGNCLFFVSDFREYKPASKRDLVIASQIHFWLKIPFEDYVDKLVTLVKDQGYLLFESHDTDTVDADIDKKISLMIDKGFVVIHSGHWVEDPGQCWIPPKKHKKIPRQYFLMRYSPEKVS
ncbi:class I SAM-dependent methyltransferase [Candidatus Pacearchaeota archaeon]|nr:class I SAM-dependent methyltransferase [Candidatus Pacearchaeota archaeon]